MRRVRFQAQPGQPRTGVWSSDGIEFGDRTFDPDEVDFLPPSTPTKCVCVGINYPDIFDEVELERTDEPYYFLKPPTAVVGHRGTVTIPRGKQEIIHEGELAVIIGEQCKNVAEADAMEVVAGFTCFNDVSNFDNLKLGNVYDWVRLKAFDDAAPVGPAMVPPEDVPEDASIELRVNGEVRQHTTRDQMVFSIPEQIAAISAGMTLNVGDIIATGTPAGIGPLEDGDDVEIEVEGVGTLEHGVQRA